MSKSNVKEITQKTLENYIDSKRFGELFVQQEQVLISLVLIQGYTEEVAYKDMGLDMVRGKEVHDSIFKKLNAQKSQLTLRALIEKRAGEYYDYTDQEMAEETEDIIYDIPSPTPSKTLSKGCIREAFFDEFCAAFPLFHEWMQELHITKLYKQVIQTWNEHGNNLKVSEVLNVECGFPEEMYKAGALVTHMKSLEAFLEMSEEQRKDKLEKLQTTGALQKKPEEERLLLVLRDLHSHRKPTIAPGTPLAVLKKCGLEMASKVKFSAVSSESDSSSVPTTEVIKEPSVSAIDNAHTPAVEQTSVSVLETAFPKIVSSNKKTIVNIGKTTTTVNLKSTKVVAVPIASSMSDKPASNTISQPASVIDTQYAAVVQRTKATIERLQQAKYDANKKIQELIDMHAGIQSEHTTLKASYATLQGNYDDLDSKYTQLQTDHEVLKKQYAALEEILKTRPAANEAQAALSELKLVLEKAEEELTQQ